jgi:arylsulfatase A-like enzyme
MVDNPMANDKYCAGKMFPETFQAAGYSTAAYNHINLPKAVSRGFSQFNHYEHPLDANVVGLFDANAPLYSASMTREVIDFVARNAGKTYFLWAHYTDTHAPYSPTLGSMPAVSKLSDYERDAAYVDYHLGRVLEALSKIDGARNTIIAITSDHGEELMDNGREGHGTSAALHTVHVPLVMWIPGCPPRKVSSPVSVADLGPTLLRLSGLPSGGNALSIEPQSSRPAVCETFIRSAEKVFVRGLFFRGFHLIVDVLHGGRMLFDIDKDPKETLNLYNDLPDVARQMEALYLEWLNRPVDPDMASCIPGREKDGQGAISFGDF